MKAIQELKICLNREEKTTLDNAAEIFDQVLTLLKYNKDNGFTAFQEGLNIYDSFWKIYNVCKEIDCNELIP